MKRYVAFLRAINVGGKNKISMSDLKVCFEELGAVDVKTCLNSGNVIFSHQEMNEVNFHDQLETTINKRFHLNIPVFILSQEELEDILSNAPDWWGSDDKETYDNLIFIMPPITSVEVCSELGEPKEEIEKITNYGNTIFWSFNRKEYQKTNWWSKTTNTKSSKKLTIRTANTVRKVVKM